MHGPTCIFWANLTAFSLQLRLRCLEEHGFVIIDDFESHPLLPRLQAASRSITALSNAKIPLSLDATRSYVHRASEKRGESRDKFDCHFKNS